MAAGEEDEARAVAVGASLVAAEVAAVFRAEAEDVVSLAEAFLAVAEAIPVGVPRVPLVVSPAADIATQAGKAEATTAAVATTVAGVPIAAVDTIGTADTDITGAATTAAVSA